jgi:alpha-tubulin suppressor-like RCC1 family protein
MYGHGEKTPMENSALITHQIQTSPSRVDITNVVGVQAGTHSSIALKADGTVWTWGSNSVGQLGITNITGSLEPAQVDIANVIDISLVDKHVLALKSDGTVWAWGLNDYGQLGIGSDQNQDSPVEVSNIDNAVDIFAHSWHSGALLSDGTVMTWGRNQYCQLGIGNYTGSMVPVQVLKNDDSSLDNVKRIDTGSRHSVALLTNGTVMAWGDNYYGQIGDNTTTDRCKAVSVPNLEDVREITARGWSTLALKSDGTLMAWGSNRSGQLGLGDSQGGYYKTPQTIQNLDYISKLGDGWDCYFAMEPDGDIWGWGRNDYFKVTATQNISGDQDEPVSINFSW